jgi:hypothetical protein
MMSVMPPPPPMAKSNNSCWKWGAIGCAGFGCLGIIGVIVLGYFVSKSPVFKQAMVAAEKSQIAMHDMQTLKTDINQYTQDKNKYPDKLADLVPKYIHEARMLHVGGNPAEPSYIYSKPPKDAPQSFVILQCDLPSPMPSIDKTPWTIRMRLDGSIENSTYRTQRGGGSFQFNHGSQ